jgi:hypothetical protein
VPHSRSNNETIRAELPSDPGSFSKANRSIAFTVESILARLSLGTVHSDTDRPASSAPSMQLTEFTFGVGDWATMITR